MSFKIIWKCILIYMDVAQKTIEIRGSEWFSSSCLFSLQLVLTAITTLNTAKPHWLFPYGKKLHLHLIGKACGQKEETGLHAFPSMPLHPPLPPQPMFSLSFHSSPCQVQATAPKSHPLGVKATWLHGQLQCWPWSGMMMKCDSAHSSVSPSGRLMLS